MALALVATAGVLGVAVVTRDSQENPDADSTSAHLIASSGFAGKVTPEALEATRPIAQQALNGTLPAPDGIDPAVAPEQLIPPRVLQAYRRADGQLAAAHPDCHLPWWLLAGVGKVASDHAAGGQVDTAGTSTVRILGPRLDGRAIGTSIVRDTDDGRLDGDLTFDRGVGPMLLLPATWSSTGSDGNADGTADVNNVDDAARSVAGALCDSGDDLQDPENLARAVLTLDPAPGRAQGVLTWGSYYRTVFESGVTPTPAPSTSSSGAPASVVPAPKPQPSTPRYSVVPTETEPSAAPPAGAPAPPITARPAPAPTPAPAPPPARPGRTAQPGTPAPRPRATRPAPPPASSTAPAPAAPSRTRAPAPVTPEAEPRPSTSQAQRPTPTEAQRPTRTQQPVEVPRPAPEPSRQQVEQTPSRERNEPSRAPDPPTASPQTTQRQDRAEWTRRDDRSQTPERQDRSRQDRSQSPQRRDRSESTQRQDRSDRTRQDERGRSSDERSQAPGRSGQAPGRNRGSNSD